MNEIKRYMFNWSNYKKETHTRVLLIQECPEMILYSDYSVNHHLEGKHETRWKESPYSDPRDILLKINDNEDVENLRQVSKEEFKKELIKLKLRSEM